jgi:N6-adenosine-specific RNA methylase IME4
MVFSMANEWPFGHLTPLSYSLLMVDPPWSFQLYSAKGQRKSAQAQYDCMTLDDIKRLPVGHLAAPDCVLFLWATFAMLREAMDTMQAWGFDYRTGGVWHKVTAKGKQAFGTGYRVRCAAEPWLLGIIGNPVTSRRERNSIIGVVREHSRKPIEAFAWAERYMPDVKRAEVFSRENRPGWDCWGAEAGKFNHEPETERQTLA